MQRDIKEGRGREPSSNKSGDSSVVVQSVLWLCV